MSRVTEAINPGRIEHGTPNEVTIMTRDQKIVAVGATSGVATMIAAVAGIYHLLPGNPGLADVSSRLAYALQANAMVSARRSWPEALRVAAVGEGTAAALRECGFESVISPREGADSEALAALDELQDLRGRSVVLFRGQGGREWLRGALEKRGARVEYAECYRRGRPAADAGWLLARWQTGGVEAVSITSSEGLANFFAILGPTGGGYLRATPVFVPHPRIELAARDLGIGRIIVTGRGDDRTVAEMAAFFARV